MMIRSCWTLMIFVIATAYFTGCLDTKSLAKSSFSKTDKAAPASVISMGRDDDDGKAKKWHIGGGWK